MVGRSPGPRPVAARTEPSPGGSARATTRRLPDRRRERPRPAGTARSLPAGDDTAVRRPGQRTTARGRARARLRARAAGQGASRQLQRILTRTLTPRRAPPTPRGSRGSRGGSGTSTRGTRPGRARAPRRAGAWRPRDARGRRSPGRAGAAPRGAARRRAAPRARRRPRARPRRPPRRPPNAVNLQLPVCGVQTWDVTVPAGDAPAPIWCTLRSDSRSRGAKLSSGPAEPEFEAGGDYNCVRKNVQHHPLRMAQFTPSGGPTR